MIHTWPTRALILLPYPTRTYLLSCSSPHTLLLLLQESAKHPSQSNLRRWTFLTRSSNSLVSLPIAIAEVPTPNQPLDIASPIQSQPLVHVLQSPEPTSSDGENDNDEDTSEMHYFSTVALNHMSSTSTKFIMDSGAGKCGTSNLSILKNVIPCQDITVTGAFGPSTSPTHTGKLGPLNLDAVHTEGMGKQTLVSLSQFCAGGTTGTKYIGVFTPTEYRMYEMHSAVLILSTLAKTGKKAERGSVQNGIYIRESS